MLPLVQIPPRQLFTVIAPVLIPPRQFLSVLIHDMTILFPANFVEYLFLYATILIIANVITV